ncbi:peptide chain release factor family protein [Neorhodopirellula pilleata]|uniref:Peptide chain release factor 1 n=1 Tax=Neorhodopirellula pilleata TaxID=2714738 RepID=A0A5C6A1L5_9BACT|nr:peptide chain release factor-like protein [Neorhodopirellula pilleata]TWT93141.1 peptide chain release factor 1 [Neorhodopirellula pilleata]
MNQESPDDTSAKWPQPEDRLKMMIVASPHPAVIDVDDLIGRCTFRTQTRSGPGGQHRNRTASGVFIAYRDDELPTEITAEATEQRNQHRNRSVAIQRLRYVLAVSIRTTSMLDPSTQNVKPDVLESELHRKYQRGALKLADENPDKPGLLALVLNDLLVAGGQPSLVVAHWGVSTSRLVGLLKSHAAAWTLVNRIRAHHDRLPLR